MFDTLNSYDTDWALHKSVNDAVWREDFTGATAETVSVRAANAQSKSLAPTEQYELSIAVHSAVGAITSNLTSARFRCFSETGMEVTGGPLYDLLKMPAPGMSQSRLIEEIVSWYAICGEFFLNLIPVKDNIGQIVPLAPTHISVHTPQRVNTRADVIQWLYRWTDGTQEFIRDDHLVFERMFNPNARSIRGLSPLVTGAVQVSGAYYAERYNKQFFENNAIPSHIIQLASGTPKVQRDAFTRQYLSTYSNYNNAAHKVAVVAADKDFDVHVLEQPFQDGAFMEMMKRGDLKVGQLYRVPAINMGIYDKSRFDTANEERKLFLEETLEPMARRIAQAFQSQLVDPFFQFSNHKYGRPIKSFGKSLRKQFERAEGERPRRGGVILILDTDELPIKHEVQLAKTEHALKLREAYDISARKAEEWVGVEFDDDRPERDEIFVPNNRVCITNPKLNEALIPGIKGDGEEDKPEEKTADPALVKSAEKFLRKVRRLTFDALDANSMWSLSQGDALAGDERLKPLVRFVRHNARKLQDKDAIKSFLNELDPTPLLHA